MTTTATATEPDTWTAQLDELRLRYKHVRPPILAAMNILLHDPGITADDAKARAQLHGVRITAASIAAAQRLLARIDDARPAPGAAPRAAAAPTTRRHAPRGVRAGTSDPDPEALIRGVVARVQAQAAGEAERLRQAVRKAIAALESALA